MARCSFPETWDKGNLDPSKSRGREGVPRTQPKAIHEGLLEGSDGHPTSLWPILVTVLAQGQREGGKAGEINPSRKGHGWL
jgi:hypothetical protein